MALVAPPTAFDERRISRKLTINIDQHEVNVRPIIKGMYAFYYTVQDHHDSFSFHSI